MARWTRILIASTLAVWLAGSGCARNEFLQIRRAPRNPLAGPLQLLSWQGPAPSERTSQLLRKYALRDLFDLDPDDALIRLQNELQYDPTPEKVYAYAELAYVVGKRADLMGNREAALNHYGAAVAHAYLYLFDPKFARQRNYYDPQFRGACDVYNAGLEGALRITAAAGLLKPGTTQRIAVGDREYDVQIEVRGAWGAEEIERLEFASDYEVHGLNNRHHTFGLGVPLIAVRKSRDNGEPAEKYYAPGLSFPVSAFLRVANRDRDGALKCVLELHDPLVSNTVQIANHIVPLETDVSTALAYFLDQDNLHSRETATLGLLNPTEAETLTGLYMLEPYDPNRIPVIMVHGLWSSPLTWMEMFNDLRSFPEVRQNFQFWFYLYPTGQPFWVSAAKLRADLAQAQQVLDPQQTTPKMRQIVLVGHSMGGLVSRMQTIESGDRFWRILSDRPFDQLQASPEERDKLARVLFFRPNPAIRRLITIATPHSGSDFANDYTRWLGRNLITLPQMMVQTSQSVMRENPDLFRSPELLTITTSIDSLAADSPILPVLRSSPTAPWIRHHNIMGVSSESQLLSFSGEGDGIVSMVSAHFERAHSEVVADADHSGVHQHPKTILEVRRILLEHLAQYHQETARIAGSPTAPPASGALAPASRTPAPLVTAPTMLPATPPPIQVTPSGPPYAAPYQPYQPPVQGPSLPGSYNRGR